MSRNFAEWRMSSLICVRASSYCSCPSDVGVHRSVFTNRDRTSGLHGLDGGEGKGHHFFAQICEVRTTLHRLQTGLRRVSLKMYQQINTAEGPSVVGQRNEFLMRGGRVRCAFVVCPRRMVPRYMQVESDPTGCAVLFAASSTAAIKVVMTLAPRPVIGSSPECFLGGALNY